MTRLQLAIAFTFGSLTALVALALPNPAPGTPETYGVGAESVYQATAFDFQATDSTAVIWTDSDAYRYMASPSTFLFLLAPLHLPEGAVIDFFRFHNCDPAGGHMTAFLIDFSGDHESAILGGVASTPRGGMRQRRRAPHPGLPERGEPRASPFDLAQRGRPDGWHRQVRPSRSLLSTLGERRTRRARLRRRAGFAPLLPVRGSALPVGHHGRMRGRELLPDAPLTRGQMAVFLAKALGLHWPNTIPFP